MVPGSPLHPKKIKFQLLLGFFVYLLIYLNCSQSLQIRFSTFTLVLWFVSLCIFFCNFDMFFINSTSVSGQMHPLIFILQNMLFAKLQSDVGTNLLFFLIVYICSKHVSVCVEQDSINTFPADVFVGNI